MKLRLVVRFLFLLALIVFSVSPFDAGQSSPTRADILRGEYGPYRANNDLLSYDLDIRVDPDKKFISGKNTIRFRMVEDATRIQLDLFANLKVEKILHRANELKFTREINTVFRPLIGKR